MSDGRFVGENSTSGALSPSEQVIFEETYDRYLAIERLLALETNSAWSPYTLTALVKYVMKCIVPYSGLAEYINYEAIDHRNKIKTFTWYDSAMACQILSFGYEQYLHNVGVSGILQPAISNTERFIASVYANVTDVSDDPEIIHLYTKISAYLDLVFWMQITQPLFALYRKSYSETLRSESKQKFWNLRATSLWMMSHPLAVGFWKYVFANIPKDWEYMDDTLRFLNRYHIIATEMVECVTNYYIDGLQRHPHFTNKPIDGSTRQQIIKQSTDALALCSQGPCTTLSDWCERSRDHSAVSDRRNKRHHARIDATKKRIRL